MQNIAILGSGITGVVLANRLVRQGHQVEIIEANDKIGGNQKSRNIGAFTFDIGTFIFPSFSPFFVDFPELWELYHPIEYCPARITPKGNVHTYPFDPLAYFSEQGLTGSARSVFDMLVGKLLNIRRRDVPEFAKYYLGRRIYEESGLRNYIERLFGLPDQDIDIIFARKRMYDIENGASFRKIFKRVVLRQERQIPFQWKIRPKSGFEVVFDALQGLLKNLGVTITLGTRLERIEDQGSSYRLVGADFDKKYDRVISTIPLGVLARLLNIPVDDEFPALRLLSLFYSHEGDPGFDNGTLYNFTADGLWKRITMLSRYYGKSENRDYFSVEITLNQASRLSVVDVQKDFEEHIHSNRLLQGDLILEGSEITNDAYPVYRVGQRQRINAMKQRLMDTGIEIAGRQGQFDYIPSAALATHKATEYLKTGRWSE